MYEGNDCGHNAEGDVVQGPVMCVGREELVQVLNENTKSLWTFRFIIGADCC